MPTTQIGVQCRLDLGHEQSRSRAAKSLLGRHQLDYAMQCPELASVDSTAALKGNFLPTAVDATAASLGCGKLPAVSRTAVGKGMFSYCPGPRSFGSLPKYQARDTTPSPHTPLKTLATSCGTPRGRPKRVDRGQFGPLSSLRSPAASKLQRPERRWRVINQTTQPPCCWLRHEGGLFSQFCRGVSSAGNMNAVPSSIL